ncbi:hypothetical protein CTAYLR_007888 [Chrysophaeum taylorii]|uniref:ILEI/PANDER domain-containing protein n=1 Tax=Chrysophaeum taylorii TaxID=2483200 RepID=A0AAD7ULG3_9STRA|nr:hypothetical protein CTAYLR_007888 [Chrysophaeum taylorii]
MSTNKRPRRSCVGRSSSLELPPESDQVADDNVEAEALPNKTPRREESYCAQAMWAIGTVVTVRLGGKKSARGHVIMHHRGGVTTMYAIQKVRVLFDQPRGAKKYEDVEVSTMETAREKLELVAGAPRVDVRMWTSGTPCMRVDDLAHAARKPDAADRERGFGRAANVSRRKKKFAGSSTVAKGLEKAEAIAASAIAADRCDDSTVVEALGQLGDDWPHQDRPNVSRDGKPVRGMMLGAVFVLGGIGMSVSNVSENFPNLTKLVTAWVRESIDEDFPFSSIQINYCYAAKKHVDSNNIGPSYIRALGDHSGGDLWVADKYVFDVVADATTGLKMVRGGGGAGTVNCRDAWALFNGNEEHYTTPYDGVRISFIVFSHQAYNKLPKDVAMDLVELGFTAASSDYVDLAYFKKFRIDKKEFDPDENAKYFRYQARRAVELPPPRQRNRLAVECYGLTMARGGGWMSFSSATPNKPAVVELTPNMTGFHVLDLELDRENGIVERERHVNRQRFNIYQKTDQETARFAKFVDDLPNGRVVVVGITDTAVAAKRPPGDTLYDTLRKLGGPQTIERIGYRYPFAFVGIKGSPAGSAVLLMGKTKHLVRIDATVAFGPKGVFLDNITREMTDITEAVILADDSFQP